MKITEKVGEYSYEYESLSRWIKIEYVTVTNRNKGLIYTAPEVDESVPAFRYANKRYYLGNFEHLPYPVIVDDVILSASEIGNWYSPLILEISTDGGYVRLWRSVNQ